MPRRIALQPQLTSAPFRVGEARRLGVSARRLEGADLTRPHHGARSPVSTPPDFACDLVPLIHADDRFSHTTAARLWPLPLPAQLQSADALVHVTSPANRNRMRRDGVVGHRSDKGGEVSRRGLTVSDPATTFIECATLLRSDDLVALGDALVRTPRIQEPRDIRPWIPLHQLQDEVARRQSRGAAAARRIIHLVRDGADSPRESLLRLALTRAGLPDPELNIVIHDNRGREIGHFDMVWPRWRVIVEYDGDQHRTDTLQYERDMTRISRAQRSAWDVVRIRAGHTRPTHAAAVEMARSALLDAGWRG